MSFRRAIAILSLLLTFSGPVAAVSYPSILLIKINIQPPTQTGPSPNLIKMLRFLANDESAPKSVRNQALQRLKTLGYDKK